MPLHSFVLETCTAPGTATTVSLIGAATGRNSFAGAGFSNGQLVEYYFLDDGVNFEYGIGTFHTGTPNTLDRTTVIGNSAGTTARLNFGGTTDVYNEIPAERAVFVDSTGKTNTGALAVNGNLSSRQTLSAPTSNYTILAADHGTRFIPNAAGTRQFTAPLASSVGAGFFFDVNNYFSPAAPSIVTVIRSGSDLFDAAGTTVWVLPNETVRFTSNGAATWLTDGRTPSGRVVKEALYTDVGGSTSSASYVLMNSGGVFAYQPVSPNSTLELRITCQVIHSYQAGVATNGYVVSVETNSGGTAVTFGTEYRCGGIVSTTGFGGYVPVTLASNWANGALAVRYFGLFTRTDNTSTPIGASVIGASIREIQG